MLELLVPAGSPEAVTAAVQNGADAVYLSFDELTGCRQAVNFSDDAFEAAVRYCRVRGCRVYLALNSLVMDDELQKAAGLALRAQRAGVDAVILRDLGLFRILRRLLPEMPLFADAALGIYTPAGAAVAAQLGFRRIFLPPELSLEEIRRITQAAAPVETAAYVQGSLCACAQGLCHMSVLAGHGSADRGLCAAPCREAFTLGGRWDTTPLSWKDRCMLRDIPALEEAGVACALLGDRDSRPEYSAAFAQVYGQAIRETQQPAGPDLERLESAFIPYGFSRKATYEAAGEPSQPGREEERFCAELRRHYTESELRRVPVEFAVSARSDLEPIRLGVRDEDGHTAVQEGPIPGPGGDLALSEGRLAEAMYRTAGTPFRCRDVKVAAASTLSVNSGELDAARRSLLYKLSEERARPPERKEGQFPPDPAMQVYPTLPAVNFSFQTAAQMTPEMAAFRPRCVYAPLELLAERPEVLEPFREGGTLPVAILPAVVCTQEEEEELLALLDKVRAAGVEQVLAGNLGVALLARQAGMALRGDTGLGVTNAYTLQNLASAGFLSATVSFQLTIQQIREMPKPLDTEILAYGRIPVMVTQTCLLKASAGRCTCATPGQMADTHGGVWPVTRHFGCRNTVWASRKLWLGDLTQEWANSGLWAARLVFSTESPRECLEVANSYLLGTGYRPNGMTRGLYYRGVE